MFFLFISNFKINLKNQTKYLDKKKALHEANHMHMSKCCLTVINSNCHFVSISMCNSLTPFMRHKFGEIKIQIKIKYNFSRSEQFKIV